MLTDPKEIWLGPLADVLNWRSKCSLPLKGLTSSLFNSLWPAGGLASFVRSILPCWLPVQAALNCRSLRSRRSHLAEIALSYSEAIPLPFSLRPALLVVGRPYPLAKYSRRIGSEPFNPLVAALPRWVFRGLNRRF